MQLTLAIIIRELIGRPRHRWFYVRRLLFVAAAVVLVGSGFMKQTTLEPLLVGRDLFRLLLLLAVAVACFAAPASASAYFAQEKEMRTLGLLLMSDISPTQLVLSRVAGSFFLVSTLCLSLLPFFAFAYQITAGADARDPATSVLHVTHIAVSFGILFSTVGLGTCIGLFLSALMMDEMMSFFGALITSACLFIVLPGMLFLMGEEIGLMGNDLGRLVLPAISPYYAVRELFEGTGLEPNRPLGSQTVSWMRVALPGLAFIGQAMVSSAILVAITSWILPRRSQAPQANVDPRHLAQITSRRQSRQIDGNPLVWKESPRTGHSLFYFSMTAGILVALPYGMNRQATVFYVGLAMFVVSAVIVGLGLLIRGALAFVHEKEMRTFELLMISGLSEEDIIMGKYWGYVKCYLPWLASLVLAFVLMAFSETFWRVAMAYLVLLTLVFAYFNLAFVLSLIFRRMIALMCILFIFLFWSVAGTFLLLSAESRVWLVSAVIVSHLAMGCFFFEMIFRIFRRHSHSEAYFTPPGFGG